MNLYQPIRSSLSFYVIESSRDGYVEGGTSDRLPISKSRRGHLRPCIPLLVAFLSAADMTIVLVADSQESTAVHVNRIMHTIIQA